MLSVPVCVAMKKRSRKVAFLTEYRFCFWVQEYMCCLRIERGVRKSTEALVWVEVSVVERTLKMGVWFCERVSVTNSVVRA